MRLPGLTARAAAVLAALAALAGAACAHDPPAERPQWTVVVTTDAPVPQFGDRVLLEILDATGGVCPECRRLATAPVDGEPLSFGVVPPPGEALPLVRARLYRGAYAGEDGLPSGASVVDALAELPVPEGNSRAELHLALACFGVGADPELRRSCDPATGRAATLRTLEPALPVVTPETSDLARARPCDGAVPDGMTCVEGGAFLLGAPRAFSDGATLDPSPERLVVLSAFALDDDEFTVGAMRRLVTEQGIGAPEERADDDTTLRGACTYLGATNGANDALPVTCVDVETARTACAALGKRLPTEAEWEFAAGNGSSETEFPWGGAPGDPCAETVVSRGRGLGRTSTGEPLGEETFCLGDEVAGWGPVAGGNELDATLSGIRNLGGNVSEWVEDELAGFEDACWAGGVLTNPVCTEASGSSHAFRGGNWASQPHTARAFARNGLPGTFSGDSHLGFRCAAGAPE